jgi:hypothetical protein
MTSPSDESWLIESNPKFITCPQCQRSIEITKFSKHWPASHGADEKPQWIYDELAHLQNSNDENEAPIRRGEMHDLTNLVHQVLEPPVGGFLEPEDESDENQQSTDEVYEGAGTNIVLSLDFVNLL